MITRADNQRSSLPDVGAILAVRLKFSHCRWALRFDCLAGLDLVCHSKHLVQLVVATPDPLYVSHAKEEPLETDPVSPTVQAIPAALQLAMLPWFPESPRYLLRNGKEDEAKRVLLKYHANGAEQDDLVDFQLMEITKE